MVLETLKTRRRLNRLIQSWIEFQTFWKRFRGAENVPPEAENRFLEIKARIAALLPLLGTVVPEPISQEATKRQREMTEFLNACPSLKTGPPLTDGLREKFEHQWHSHYLFLNQLTGHRLGVPGAKTAKRPMIQPRSVPSGMPTKRRRSRWSFGGFFSLVFGVFLLGTFAYLMLLVFGSRLIGNQQQLSGERDLGRLGELAQDIWERTPDRITTFFEPVVTTYGVEVTIAFFGVFLLAIGYWVFIRGR